MCPLCWGPSRSSRMTSEEHRTQSYDSAQHTTDTYIINTDTLSIQMHTLSIQIHYQYRCIRYQYRRIRYQYRCIHYQYRYTHCDTILNVHQRLLKARQIKRQESSTHVVEHALLVDLPIAHPPQPQVVSRRGQQVGVVGGRVRDPHHLRGGVRVVESEPVHQLAAILIQLHYLNLGRRWCMDNSMLAQYLLFSLFV